MNNKHVGEELVPRRSVGQCYLHTGHWPRAASTVPLLRAGALVGIDVPAELILCGARRSAARIETALVSVALARVEDGRRGTAA